MAYKTLLFGTDDLFAKLQPFYDEQVQLGNLEIVAYAVFENNGVRIVPLNNKTGGVFLTSIWR